MLLTEKSKFNWNRLKSFLCLSAVTFLMIFSLFRKETDCSWRILSTKGFEKKSSTSDGCALRKYSKGDVEQCFRRLQQTEANTSDIAREVIFVGSREVEFMYLAFLRQFLEGSSFGNVSTQMVDDPNHKLHEMTHFGLRTEFIDQPYPNSTLINFLEKWKRTSISGVIVAGFFPFDGNNEDSKSLEFFISNVSSLAFEMDLVSEKRPFYWLISKVQFSKATFYEEYKQRIYDVLKGTHVKLWDISPRQKFFPRVEEGMEYSFEFEVQVLDNYFCNKLQTNSTTICCSLKRIEKIQKKIVFIIFIALSFVIFCMICFHYCWKDGLEMLEDTCDFPGSCQRASLLNGISKTKSQEPPELESQKEVKEKFCYMYYCLLFVKCILIFAYFFICDRTNLFEKQSKVFSYESFYIPLIVSVMVAFLFQARSTGSKPLGREITDEWKGWMQILILIYHFTGASSQLHIYMQIRILVSSYLFMTGYGNLCYYWHGGELTFRRYCQVMLRMNLLTIVLCIVMKRPYQSYYFVPLVSFWYTVLFILLLLPPRPTLKFKGVHLPCNKDYLIAAVKLMLFFGLVTALSLSKKVFDAIFLLPCWRFLFELPGQVDYEWWFRWKLDRYSIIYGAAFGLVHKYVVQNQNPEENSRRQPTWRVFFFVLLGVGSAVSYSLLFTVCSTKQECNAIHPFIVWIPILGYILVRNLTENFRMYHSVVMANAGKISLELFISQYHILLAADTRGILVLLPWGHSIINVGVVSLLFVCVAYEVHSITGDIVNIIIPKDHKKIARNLFFLFVIFIFMKVILR